MGTPRLRRYGRRRNMKGVQGTEIVRGNVVSLRAPRYRMCWLSTPFGQLRGQAWLAPPLQSQISSWVPLVWLAPGTSRQRLEPVPMSRKLGGGGGPETGVMDRLSNWAVSPWLVPTPTWPVLQALSVTVRTVAPSIVATMVVPENDRPRLCHRLVPSVATVPLAMVVIVLLVSLRRIDHAPVSE